MEVFGDKKTSKNISKFICGNCDFKCSKLGDYNRHILTPKHMKLTLANDLGDTKNIKLVKKYICNICNKNYDSRNGLWKHKKKCEIIHEKNIEETKPIVTSDLSPEIVKLITQLVKGQNGIQESIVELCKNGTTMNNSHNTNNIHTNNSHNRSFNLQFFLNETCKDAMNIMDFVDSIKLQLSDLERVGELGYVEGISNIIVKNLNALDVTQRPVHCTDKKREVLYVKDEDKWEKEDDNNKIRKAIKKVANKNVRLLPEFKIKYPDCSKSSSNLSDKYNKIIIESMGGSGDNDLEKEDKIIKKITKEVIIDKDNI